MDNLKSIIPFFIVNNLNVSIAFYKENLGFSVQHMSPADNPFFAIVGRDEISIMLKEIKPDIKPVPNYLQHEWARWDVYISVADPDVLFEEYQSKNILFNQPLINNSDGLYGFEIKDADSYVLFFGRPSSL